MESRVRDLRQQLFELYKHQNLGKTTLERNFYFNSLIDTLKLGKKYTLFMW